MASAKQRAWRKRFAAMAKSGKWRKSRSHNPRRKTARRGASMAKKKFKRRSGGLGGIKSLVKAAAAGIGAGVLVSIIAPNIQIPFKEEAAGFLVAGPVGAAGAFGVKALLNGNGGGGAPGIPLIR